MDELISNIMQLYSKVKEQLSIPRTSSPPSPQIVFENHPHPPCFPLMLRLLSLTNKYQWSLLSSATQPPNQRKSYAHTGTWGAPANGTTGDWTWGHT